MLLNQKILNNKMSERIIRFYLIEDLIELISITP
jgi:hypothetical protein